MATLMESYTYNHKDVSDNCYNTSKHYTMLTSPPMHSYVQCTKIKYTDLVNKVNWVELKSKANKKQSIFTLPEHLVDS